MLLTMRCTGVTTIVFGVQLITAKHAQKVFHQTSLSLRYEPLPLDSNLTKQSELRQDMGNAHNVITMFAIRQIYRL